ncbi:tetratricopeptide repeat protein [Phorcysia thermohydrogeniphila]|uniref:TPR repeat protein n=1 Tax=Phorcysia thermohydrogeniphila TaxID=936138 RepID=A0A4V2PCW8_9BACT|nr:tetratricopeptide repeat protein [Phorcysia thermohydrogeniphila]TCK02896.1 TPR repeat protein [Phorcysia thermohydrogeniphila]
MLLRVLLALVLLVSNALAESPEVQKAMTAMKSGNLKEAYKILEASCKTGNQESCASLGEFYMNGWEVKRDLDKAYQLLSKACSEGIALGCSDIGIMYMEGLKFSKDPKKALKFFLKACNRNSFGQEIGCYNSGLAFFLGKGVDTDYSKALSFFLKSCNLGYTPGCNNVGIIYERGLVAKKDIKKALNFYNIACLSDDITAKKVGCYNLGKLLYKVGKKDEESLKKVTELLSTSCNLGYQAACDELKKISLTKERPSPFGLTVGVTTEDEFKEIVKNKGWQIVESGYRVIKNDISNPDVTGYKVAGLPLEKLKSAYFWFFKGKLMKIDYRLEEFMDKSTFYMYYDLLKNKYGTPLSYKKPQVSEGRALWKIGGVEIELYCPWVTTTTYLSYTDPDLYSKAAESDRAVYEEQTKKKAKSLEGI